MPEDALLSDLCSLCYAETPKYRCPRCSTRTCSLPCCKRHQQQASCNGKRNPAAYLKKKDLATPVGLDHDYNYLKSVELGIEQATKERIDRGIGMKTNAAAHRGAKPGSQVDRYLVENRINVQRAPRGMTRDKTNKTRTSKKSDKLFWTVEWIILGHEAYLHHDSLASDSLVKNFDHMLRQKQNAMLPKVPRSERPSSKNLKRKRQEQQQQGDSAAEDVPETLSLPVTPALDTNSAQVSTDPSNHALRAESTSRHLETATSSPCKDASNADNHFYLHRPGAAAASKVLIPLDATLSVTELLRAHTVLEYPTIYVLPHAPASLPSGFMLEEQYLKERKVEESELREAMRKSQSEGVVHRAGAVPEPTRLDPSKILDMLKRDITR